MTIKIDLPPEIESSLAAMAAAHGMALPDDLQHLLSAQVTSHRPTSLTPADRARLWRQSAEGMPHTAPLSDDAVGRERFYDAPGSLHPSTVATAP